MISPISGHLPSADDRLVELDVGVGVLAHLGGDLVAARTGRPESCRPASSRVARLLGGEPRRHALQRRPDRDHVEDLGLGLAHDEDAAAGDDPDQAFLVELRQRLAQRRAADAEALRQIALVEPQLGVVGVDVHVHDGGLERLVGARLEAQALADRSDFQLRVGHGRTLTAGTPHYLWFLVYHTPHSARDASPRPEPTCASTVNKLASIHLAAGALPDLSRVTRRGDHELQEQVRPWHGRASGIMNTSTGIHNTLSTALDANPRAKAAIKAPRQSLDGIASG